MLGQAPTRVVLDTARRRSESVCAYFYHHPPVPPPYRPLYFISRLAKLIFTFILLLSPKTNAGMTIIFLAFEGPRPSPFP
ncbi:hypothetical protein EJ04DRAFT_122990 [Polyplosphaeria fusca]|uniref:Uncharacterized protein n=1 Tax=Polyplosphaeria fusca TaxID=682080 RepID=A0A9P4QN08_9PLEO|nr:hypothetical protein EJ04DRAFT_122990 [Polyplosphaeria fusca]